MEHGSIFTPVQFLKHIFDHHHIELLRYTRGMINQLQESEDLLQEFYVKLYSKHQVFIPKFQQMGIRYIKRSLANHCKDYFRAKKKAKENNYSFVDINESILEIPEPPAPDYSTTMVDIYLAALKQKIKSTTFEMLLMKLKDYSCA